MERAPDAAGPTLGVAPSGDLEGGRVGLDDRVEDRIEAVDPTEIGLRQLDRRELTGRQARAELRDRCFEPRSGRVPVDGWDQRGTDGRIVATTGPRRGRMC